MPDSPIRNPDLLRKSLWNNGIKSSGRISIPAFLLDNEQAGFITGEEFIADGGKLRDIRRERS